MTLQRAMESLARRSQIEQEQAQQRFAREIEMAERSFQMERDRLGERLHLLNVQLEPQQPADAPQRDALRDQAVAELMQARELARRSALQTEKDRRDLERAARIAIQESANSNPGAAAPLLNDLRQSVTELREEVRELRGLVRELDDIVRRKRKAN